MNEEEKLPLTDAQKQQLEETQKKQAILHATKRLFNTDDGKVVLNFFISTNCVVEKFVKDPVENAWLQSRRAFVMELAASVYGPDFFAPLIKSLLTPIENPDQSFIQT